MAFSLYVDPLILIVAAVLIGIGFAALVIHYKNKERAINKNIRFAPEVRKAITGRNEDNPLALCVLMNPGTYNGRVLVGEIDPENRAIFKFESQGIGEHLVPESHVKPLMLNGLRIFFGNLVEAEFMSVDEIYDNNRLAECREQFENLRGIPLSTLKAMLEENAADWEINCAKKLEEIQLREDERGIEYCGIPESVDEFVQLLTDCKKMYLSAPETTYDTTITTYESVYRKQKPKVIQKTAKGFKGIVTDIKGLFKDKKREEAISKLDFTPEYQYRNMYRKYVGIKWISPIEALAGRTSSLTVSRLREYGMQMEQKGKLASKAFGDSFMEKWGKVLLPVGIFLFLACLGVGVMFSMFGK